MNKDSDVVKVLLVDDSDDDRLLFMAAFRKSGIPGQVLEKEDGDEAVEFFSHLMTCAQTEWPKVIFLDLKMPGRNGFDVLQWIREKPLLKPMKIIVLSGSHEPSDIKRARDLGAADYIVKPIKAETIQEILSPYRAEGTHG